MLYLAPFTLDWFKFLQIPELVAAPVIYLVRCKFTVILGQMPRLC